MTDDLKVNLEVNTGSSTQDVKKLSSALESVGEALRGLGNTKAANDVDKVSRSLQGEAKAAQQAAKSLTDYQRTSQYLATTRPKDYTLNTKGQAVSTATGSRVLAAEAAEQAKVVKQEEARAKAIQRLTLMNQAAAKAELDHMNRLTNLRYTLYDVQRSFIVTGVALLGFNALTLKAAADYQTAMAQISRTSGVGGDALVNLQHDFEDLAGSIPTSFGNLSQIATLAGQLNIPASRVADFTKQTAMFAATTNVSAEAAATAFGRLDALLPDVNGQYDKLGSSILNVGVNSVATESEIINTTNQIAAAGAQAGFATDEIVGLAASFASLGVAPEAARGTTIRFFSTINTAISQGGENLQKFATLSGMSAEEFKKAWKDDAGGAFLDLLNGMKKVSDSGQNLEAIIRSMGITAVRDINALLKLSQNAEIVGDNFSYAADGFQNANQLANAFGIQSATVASKIQMLVNSVQAFFAELGGSSLGPVGALVDLLNGLLKVFTAIARNPVVQTMTLIIGAFTTLVGIVSLAGFALTRLVSATIAVRTAFATLKVEAVNVTGGFGGMSAQAAALSNQLYGTSISAKAMAGALKTIGLSLGAMALVSVAIWGVTAAIDASKSSADKAKEAFGDLSGLTNALQQDTNDVLKGTQTALGHIDGQITTNTTTTQSWVKELEDATGTQLDLGKSVEDTTTSVDQATFAIGKNTAAWLANKLATDSGVQTAFKKISEAAKAGAPGADIAGIISASVRNDTKEATRLIDEYQKKVDAFAEKYSGDGSKMFAAAQANAGIGELRRLVDLTTGSLQEASAAGQVQTAVNEGLGVSSENAAHAAGDLAENTEAVVDALQQMRDTVEAAFSSQNLISAMSDDFYNLASSIYEGGTAFDAFSQSGIDNLNNFQQSIASIIVAGQSMGLNATQSVAVLFNQLQAMGVDTANLLAQVANIPGLDATAIQQSMGSTTVQGSKLNQVLGLIGKSAQVAGSNLDKKTGGGAKKAAKEVRTLVDYANDLQSAFSRAFDIRFSAGDAMDKITSGWYDVADATAEANANIQDIQVSLEKLQSTRSINSYFLQMAQTYGDVLRANDLKADIADNDKDIADANKDLATAQSKTNKTLVGNTKAAIANRATIEGMVQNWQDYIQALAASGASQATIDAAIRRGKQSFVDQATQLGFNKKELEKYTNSFNDMATIVGKVPRNITVTANTNPAIQALNELDARIKKTASTPVNIGGSAAFDDKKKQQLMALAKQLADLFKKAFEAESKKNPIKLTGWVSKDGQPVYKSPTGLQFFKSGGYTGDGSSSAISGVTHGKEFVVNAENTAKFRPILEAMNKGRMPIMQTPSQATVAVVELSPVDRKLLAQAGNAAIFLDGRVLAGAVSKNNVGTTNKGVM